MSASDKCRGHRTLPTFALKWDSYCCRRCLRWLMTPACDDTGCETCKDRPEVCPEEDVCF